MPQISITQLPQAQALTGFESVPIVQGGVTVQTTTGQIAGVPNLGYSFVTATSEPALGDSRSLAAGSGLSITDNGAGSTLQVNLTGAALSLDSSPTGLQVKVGPNTLTGRSIAVTAGLAITDGDGIAGNPTIGLGTFLSNFASLTGTGILAIQSGTVGKIQILPTSSQTTVTNSDGSADVTIGLASNPVIPGTGAMVIPVGTTAQQPAGTVGSIRYNSTTGTFDGYAATGWQQFSTAGGVTTFSAGSTGFTPVAATSGAVTLGGTLNVASGGTGANTLTGYVIGNGTSAMTASATIPTTDLSGQITNAQLQNNSITVNGTSISLGGSATITAAVPNALTVGTGLQFNSGTTYDGSVAKTIGIDSTVVTLTGAQILTGKTLSGNDNTFSNIPNVALTNSSVTFNGTTVALGGTGTITAAAPYSATFNDSGSGVASGTTYDGSVARTISYNTLGASPLAGSTSLITLGTITTGVWHGSTIDNNYLTNSSITIGTTAISLGSSSLTLGGLTSVAVTQDPTSALQLATKQYVDAVAEGLHVHAACAAATTGTLASITGGTVTYNNGSGGVGATLTLSVALTTLDGYTLQNGDRVLVKNEATQANNGIYTWATGGTVLTRATDFDTPTEIASGDFTFVSNGTSYANTGWVQTLVVTTVGTSPIVFVQFSGAGTYTAGTGLTLSGSQFSITNTGVTANTYGSASVVPVFAVNAQGQLTSVTDTSIAINGNQITSGTVGSAYITGSYTGITGVGTLTAGTWNASTIGVGYGGTGLTTYTTGDLVYATGTATLSKLGIGTIDYILTSSGTAPQWSAPSGISVGTATNLAGGTAGSVPYQSGAGATTFLSLGTTNYVLTAGASAPQYVAQSTLSVGTATNLAGGAANQIAYQTATATTGFITAPSVSSTFLQWNGTAFVWATAAAGTVTSVDVSGGTTGLTFSGGPITSSGTITMSGTLAIANGGTNSTTSPTAGAVAYGTGTAYSFTAAGTSGQVLTSAGTGSPTWTSQSSLSVGTATNIAGGSAGALAYNSASGTTTFLSLGTTNYVLTAGASAPQYVAQSTLSVGSATTATNIAGGTANQIPYQTGAGATAFITAPTVASTSLQWNGSAFTWASAGSAITVTNDTSTATAYYPLFATATSGTVSSVYTSNAKLLYKPSTGELSASEVIATNGIVLNATTINASYTIATGNNGFSVGPVTIASGQSVTVSSGQRWVVI